MTRPTDPPESLMAQWWIDAGSEPRWSHFMAKKGIEWGHQQAMQDRAEIAALLRELAGELYSYSKTRPIDSPNYKRQSDLMQRAHAMADRLQPLQEKS